GWSPAVADVNADATYKATYTATARTYTVTFKDGYSGKVLKTQKVAYGKAATAPASPTRTGYTFAKWDKAFNKVTSNLTVTATWKINTYKITWKDGDGKVLKTDTLAYGATPKYTGKTPTKKATAQYTYTFKGWPTVAKVTKAATYTAQFTSTANKYKVTWKDGDGKVLKTDTLAYGATPKYTGATPTKKATAQYTYKFKGWPAVAKVTKAATYTAQFTSTVNSYTVTFKDGYSNKVLKTQKVAYGKGATAPAAPKRADYAFAKWDKAFTRVTGNLTVSAVWKADRIWERLAGAGVYDTMAAISGKLGASTTAVVASTASEFRDMLAATALAGSHGAPMLLTRKAELMPQTASELRRMGAKTVYVMGGAADVTDAVVAQIKALPSRPSVVRVGASTASASSKAVAAAKAQKSRSDTVIVATQASFADALSISPYAYATKSPVLYAEANRALSAETLEYIRSAGYKRAIVVGGPVALPAKVEEQLASAGVPRGSVTRLAGAHQYATSRVIAEWAMGRLANGTGGTGLYQYASIRFQPTVKLGINNAGVSRGDAWYDALAGAALCGQKRSVLLLADGTNSANATAVVSANKAALKHGYVFGGPVAVPQATYDALDAAVR
ncbi:MAG: cell wall-binding repeat-containing protein, partial [Eggerthellaceae bacterium]|nr:cell wall-binding repeat-containing protein [Eggerthellaceae bacterium]